MNKNSTQKKTRDFVSKISDFFKIVPTLPAYLRIAPACILVQLYHSVAFEYVLKTLAGSFFNPDNNCGKKVLLQKYIPDHLIVSYATISSNSCGIYNFSSNAKVEPGVTPVITNQY